MTTTAPPPAGCSPDPPPASSSFTNRLRRLSLRPHSNQTDRSRSYRNRLSWVVGLSQSPPTTLLLDEPGEQQQQEQHQHQQRSQSQSFGLTSHNSTSEQNLAELQFSAQRDSYISRSDGSGSESPNSELQSNPSSTSSRSSQGHNTSDSLPSGEMARVRNTSVVNTERVQAQPSNSEQPQPQPQPQQEQQQEEISSTAQQSSSLAVPGNDGGDPAARQNSTSPTPRPKQLATIRFFAYQDPHQNARPSLPFAPMTRTLPDETCVIKVGRFSERDGTPVTDPAEPSSAPVGFKSKVVSRKHCEFSLVGGQWHVKDVGSSSGTFLNHMRLSQPNMPSRHYSVRDGDIVQLGIDFRGGEEMIFRSVRIRIECNRMWQQRPNEFNKNTENLINNLGKGSSGDYSGCRECSICLGSVLRPYQCLFMAACAHVWHYKCVRRLIHSPEYPMFQCPNCRAYTDLNAEVDDSTDIYDDQSSKEPSNEDTPVPEPEPVLNSGTDNSNTGDSTGNNERELSPNSQGPSDTDLLASAANNLRINDSELQGHELQQTTTSVERIPPSQPNETSEPVSSIGQRSSNIDIPNRDRDPLGRVPRTNNELGVTGSPSFADCPLTPTNDLGPLAFDGRAGRL